MTDLIERLRALLAKATPGPWRVYTSIDIDTKDRSKITEQRWGLAAGKQEGPHKNIGHFHPSEALYFVDELRPVEISSDRDYGYPEGACEKQEDAALIAESINALPTLLDALEAKERELRERKVRKAQLEALESALAAMTAQRDEAVRERDLAIAHDRQPYPTAWAYEQVCKARDAQEALRLAAEASALASEKDAGRYRWLRQTDVHMDWQMTPIEIGLNTVSGNLPIYRTGDDLDAAIDASRGRDG